MGKYGKFLACPGFPECRNIKPIVQTINERCPICGGEVQVRKTKRGKNYYICENNKNDGTSCIYISWNKPKAGEKYTREEFEKLQEEQTEKPKLAKKRTTRRKTTKKKK